MKALFKCHSIEFLAATRQALEFVHDLSETNWTRLAAQGSLLADALETGTPPVGRTRRVRGTRHLWELEVTPPQSSGPQAHLLFTVEEGRVLFFRGVSRGQGRLRRQDIELAERDVAAHERTEAGEGR